MSGYATQIAAILIVNIVAAYSAYMPLACGQLNLGIAGFMAIGGYASAVLSAHGVTLGLSILAAHAHRRSRDWRFPFPYSGRGVSISRLPRSRFRKSLLRSCST